MVLFVFSFMVLYFKSGYVLSQSEQGTTSKPLLPQNIMVTYKKEVFKNFNSPLIPPIKMNPYLEQIEQAVTNDLSLSDQYQQSMWYYSRLAINLLWEISSPQRYGGNL